MAFDIEVVAMARRLAHHASARQGLVAENVANADTVGFRARDLRPFSEVYEAGDVNASGADVAARAGREALSSFAPNATRPGHSGFDPIGSPELVARAPSSEPVEIARLGADSANGNSVSVEDQMARGALAVANHEMALAIMRTAGNILRASIGRA